MLQRFRNAQRVLSAANAQPILHAWTGDLVTPQYTVFASTTATPPPEDNHAPTHTVVHQPGLLRLEPRATHESTIVWLHGMGQTGAEWQHSGVYLGT